MEDKPKETENKQINFRIDRSLFEKVKEIARREDRTVSYIIKRIVRSYVERTKSERTEDV